MGPTQHPLEVTFNPPSAGGITMQLVTPEHSLSDNFSHIYPTLSDLCAALWEAGKRVPTRPVVFLLEPAELELRILPLADDETSELSIRLFPGRARQRESDPIFTCMFATRSLIFAFWRALRRLQTSLTPVEFQREWRGPFPDAAMAALTVLVDSWKRAGTDGGVT